MAGFVHLAAAKCHRAAQIHTARIEQTANEEHHRGVADGPYHLALVHRVNVVNLHTDVAGRTGTVEHGQLYDVFNLHLLQTGVEIRLYANAQMRLCHFRQCLQTCHEVLFLTLHLVAEVTCQRFVSQSRDEDGLGHCLRTGRDGVRQLVDIAKDARIEQCLNHIITTHLCHVTLTIVYVALLLVGFHLYAEHLPALTTLDGSHTATHRRGKLHLRISLVDKQRLSGFDMVTLMDNDLRRNTLEIVGHQRIASIGLQLELRFLSLALESDV